MKKCIILANGQYPGKSLFKYLKDNGYRTLICADGGANSAKKIGLTPDYIIGDFDSMDPDVRKYYSGKCKIIRYSGQNDTDVEKCLKFAIRNKYTEAVLLGATGDRLDHSFCNLGIVLKFYDLIKIKIIHQKSVLSAYSKGLIEFDTHPGEIISIYGFTDKTKITSHGLKYPLSNLALAFGERESTSNAALKNKVTLKISSGKIFVIRDLHTLKKHDLFQLA